MKVLNLYATENYKALVFAVIRPSDEYHVEGEIYKLLKYGTRGNDSAVLLSKRTMKYGEFTEFHAKATHGCNLQIMLTLFGHRSYKPKGDFDYMIFSVQALNDTHKFDPRKYYGFRHTPNQSNIIQDERISN